MISVGGGWRTRERKVRIFDVYNEVCEAYGVHEKRYFQFKWSMYSLSRIVLYLFNLYGKIIPLRQCLRSPQYIPILKSSSFSSSADLGQLQRLLSIIVSKLTDPCCVVPKLSEEPPHQDMVI